MRSLGIQHPQDFGPVPPDTVNTLLIAGSSGQAMDWPAGSSQGGLVRFSGVSTAGAQLNFMVNMYSTAVIAPASGSSVSSSGVSHPVMGQADFQLPGNSTGFSVAALSSGYVFAQIWKKGG